MNILLLSETLAVAGLLAGAYGLSRRFAATRRRALPTDRSVLKGNPTYGVAHAFTAGMLPWAKESTRLHMIAYLRGIGFHIGIFAAVGALLVSPLPGYLPRWAEMLLVGVLALGSLLGAAGGILRLLDRNLRGLSLPDDHFAVWLVTLFMAVTTLGVAYDGARVAMYIVAAATFAYVPLGKIRHCLYFFFSRVFFGRFFGRRAVIPHAEPVEGRPS